MKFHSISSRNRGFSLIEVTIVLALVTILISFGLFMTLDSYRGFIFRSERSVVVSVLEKARSHALSNINQSAWGVCGSVASSSYVVFQGSSYSASGVTDSIPSNKGVSVTSLPSNAFSCVPGGGIVFTQLSATTSSTTLTIVENARASVIAINNEGTIIW